MYHQLPSQYASLILLLFLFSGLGKKLLLRHKCLGHNSRQCGSLEADTHTNRHISTSLTRVHSWFKNSRTWLSSLHFTKTVFNRLRSTHSHMHTHTCTHTHKHKHKQTNTHIPTPGQKQFRETKHAPTLSCMDLVS